MTRRAGFLGDSRVLSVTAMLAAVVASAAFFVISFQGLQTLGTALYLGAWGAIVPVAFDGTILVAGLLAAVRRGQKRRAGLEIMILVAATLWSSAANFLIHTPTPIDVLAAATAAACPFFFLALTESIIRTIIQDEVVIRKPRRAAKTAPVTDTTVATSQHTPDAEPVRKPRAVAMLKPLTSVEGMSQDALLERARVLAPDPASRARGSQESLEFRAVALALIDNHGWTPTTLAAEVGDPDRNRIERVTRKLRQELTSADAA